MTSVPSGAPSVASWPLRRWWSPTDARCTTRDAERTYPVGSAPARASPRPESASERHVHARPGLQLDFEADVCGRRRVRQRPHGDEIRAGLRQRSDAVERDATGDLHLARGRGRAARLHERHRAAGCPPAAHRLPPPARRPPARGSAPRPRSARSGRMLPRAREPRIAIPPASRMWLSLIRNASYRPKRWFVPPPMRTAYFSSARSVGVVFRVSRIVIRPPDASTKRRVMRGHARQPLQEVERDPLGREQRARGPSHLADDCPRLARRALVDPRRQHGRRIDEREGRGGDRHPSDDERGFGQQHAVARAHPPARSRSSSRRRAPMSSASARLTRSR